jgi:hypothetical protein
MARTANHKEYHYHPYLSKSETFNVKAMYLWVSEGFADQAFIAGLLCVRLDSNTSIGIANHADGPNLFGAITRNVCGGVNAKGNRVGAMNNGSVRKDSPSRQGYFDGSFDCRIPTGSQPNQGVPLPLAIHKCLAKVDIECFTMSKAIDIDAEIANTCLT